MIIDANITSNELIPVALGALELLVSGWLLYIVQRRDAVKKEQTDNVEKALKAGKRKDENLGFDIQETRAALNWLLGKLGYDPYKYNRPSDTEGSD